MRYVLSLLAVMLCVACGDMQSGPSQAQREQAELNKSKKCTDCGADDLKGPDSYKVTTCTARSSCKNNNQSILDWAANDYCRNNVITCTGKCEKGYHCDSIYDRPNSGGVTVQGKIVPGGNCKAPLVNCEVTLNVPKDGTLACKCSCNPDKKMSVKKK